jgi:hypothetical protein
MGRRRDTCRIFKNDIIPYWISKNPQKHLEKMVILTPLTLKIDGKTRLVKSRAGMLRSTQNKRWCMKKVPRKRV